MRRKRPVQAADPQNSAPQKEANARKQQAAKSNLPIQQLGRCRRAAQTEAEAELHQAKQQGRQINPHKAGIAEGADGPVAPYLLLLVLPRHGLGTDHRFPFTRKLIDDGAHERRILPCGASREIESRLRIKRTTGPCPCHFRISLPLPKGGVAEDISGSWHDPRGNLLCRKMASV